MSKYFMMKVVKKGEHLIPENVMRLSCLFVVEKWSGSTIHMHLGHLLKKELHGESQF